MSTVATPPSLVNPDDVLETPEGKYCEPVDGQLLEKRRGSIAQDVGTRISRIPGNYRDSTGLAHVLAEAGIVCFPSKPRQMRRPDVSCVLVDRMPFDRIPRGFMEIRPDIAIEVISPDDKVMELEEKLDDYRDAGIPLVWVVYPELKRVRIMPLDGSPITLGAEDGLTAQPMLPGFRCRVGELFLPAGA